ncbi:hypothetical protein IWQ56_006718, partial [Coemansia nantahalensis]
DRRGEHSGAAGAARAQGVCGQDEGGARVWRVCRRVQRAADGGRGDGAGGGGDGGGAGQRAAAAVAQDGHPDRRQGERDPQDAARAQAAHGVRGGAVPKHGRVLGRRQARDGHGDDHDHGRHMHARVPVLLGQDQPQPGGAGRQRADKRGIGARGVGAGLHCADLGGPRRPGGLWRGALCRDRARDPRARAADDGRVSDARLPGPPRADRARGAVGAGRLRPQHRDRRVPAARGARLPRQLHAVAVCARARQAHQAHAAHKVVHHARRRRVRRRGDADHARSAHRGRRHRHPRPVHAPHQAPHEGPRVCRPRPLQPLGAGRQRPRLPLHRERPARALVLQGRRVLHHRDPPQAQCCCCRCCRRRGRPDVRAGPARHCCHHCHRGAQQGRG